MERYERPLVTKASKVLSNQTIDLPKTCFPVTCYYCCSYCIEILTPRYITQYILFWSLNKVPLKPFNNSFLKDFGIYICISSVINRIENVVPVSYTLRSVTMRGHVKYKRKMHVKCRRSQDVSQGDSAHNFMFFYLLYWPLHI